MGTGLKTKDSKIINEFFVFRMAVIVKIFLDLQTQIAAVLPPIFNISQNFQLPCIDFAQLDCGFLISQNGSLQDSSCPLQQRSWLKQIGFTRKLFPKLMTILVCTSHIIEYVFIKLI